MEDVEDIYELSPMQHGMLFDSVTAGDTGMYLIQLEYFLDGTPDFEALRRAWQLAVDRHPILRTSFHWDGMEKPLQVVHREVTVDIAQIDWSGLPDQERDAKLVELRDADRGSGCDFEQAPLMRMTLVKVGDTAYRLLWTFHHILMEGWSASMILDEVLGDYRQITTGTPYTAPQHRPYRDFVAWAQDQDANKAEEYWRGQLAGFDTPTHLGVDLSPTSMHEPVTRFDGKAVTLTTEETTALTEFAKRHGLTLNTVIQGAWALMLSRYSGTDDVVFGTIVSGRAVPIEDVDSIVGLFVNLLPSRIRTSPAERLLPWLQGLQASQARQRDFEYCSLVEVKGWSDIPAGLPLFESILVFENWSGDLTVSDWDPNLSVRDVHGHHGAPGYPMAAVVIPARELTFGISYDLERFTPEAIERILDNLTVLLRALPQDPDRALADLPLLSEDERLRMLVAWNDTGDGVSTEPCVHDAFARRAATTPEAVAVVHGETTLTYRELDEQANRLANLLTMEGVAPGTRVGLCVEREPSMVVSVLGILKAGATYVPIDPSYPEERIRYLLEDARVAVLLTQERLTTSLPATEGARRILVDAEPRLAQLPPTDPSVEVSPHDVAYVIYTSGSTGKPKGVMIPHGALANYVAFAIEAFSMVPEDRMLQFASISFDTAAEEIYPTLLTGATLVLRNDDILGSVAAFLEFCGDQGITIIDFPTAYWHMVVDGLADAGTPFPPSVRFAILGGERAKPEQLARWFQLLGERPLLINTYGPTEATIVATTSYLRPPAQGHDVGEPPIGRPVRNARAYVLDARGEPVPLGVPGELHISGAGLARGYFERPALTAERFVPDPFSSRDGARMYRTGDLVRHRPDGELEFVGRVDTQVKFRGYRIELEEIEATLASHDAVKEAVVLLREDTPGVQKLVAYAVAPGTSGSSAAELPAELKRHAQERLPGYMVPSTTVVLDALPLTSHGKVDRRALPVPDAAPATGAAASAPRTPTEEKIAEIWRDVLDLDRVGVHDNFFDLGGHSLLLMPVIGRIKDELGVKLTPGELVVPTLGQLATLCDEREGEPQEEEGERKAGLMKKLFGALRGSVSPGNAS